MSVRWDEPMAPFLEHMATCVACMRDRRHPCRMGEQLLKDGADRLTRRLCNDPRRAQS